jgi:nicotinamidase-related amidase
MKSALLVIDIQKDYFPGGKMELKGSAEASLYAKQLLSRFRERNMQVVHVQHISNRPGASFFLPGTEGVCIHENVSPLDGETVIQKHFPNSFRDTALLEYLAKEGVTHLVISGMMTHMCVDATTRAAFDYGFECTVVSNACATKDLTFEGKLLPAEHVHTAFLAALNAVYARIIRAEDFVASTR